MIFKQYVKFLINGGLIGVVAWAIQALLFQFLGGADGSYYALASLLTYAPLILLNFSIQRRLIFSMPGRLSRFVLANALVMLFVSALSPYCRWVGAWMWGAYVGDQTGFIMAALIGATPSFLLSRLYVFKPQSTEASA